MASSETWTGNGAVCVIVTILGEGGRKRSAISEFFIRLSVDLRWILQIRLFKIWKLERLCIKNKNTKTQTPSRCSLAPHLKWRYFQIRTLGLPSTTPRENAVLFCIEWVRRKTAGNVNRPGLSGVKRRFRHRLYSLFYNALLIHSSGLYR